MAQREAKRKKAERFLTSEPEEGPIKKMSFFYLIYFTTLSWMLLDLIQKRPSHHNITTQFKTSETIKATIPWYGR